MTDLAHTWGGDLTLSATGDLLTADGDDLTTQRVLRRLLTNLNDYLWHPDYGAGLPGYVGSTIDEDALTALIRAQMYREAGVARSPEPVVAVQAIANGFAVQIGYTDANSGQPADLGFNLTNEV